MIAEYLTSPQAREDVRALLASGARPGRVQNRIGPTAWLEIELVGVWTQVTYVFHDEVEVNIYYRLDGDRFIVSDLGEGAKAQRLRTGILFCLDVRNWVDGIVRCSEGMIFPFRGPTKPDDLPDAICRVMLASWRVANLGSGS
jgi:hypothetical protein